MLMIYDTDPEYIFASVLSMISFNGKKFVWLELVITKSSMIKHYTWHKDGEDWTNVRL